MRETEDRLVYQPQPRWASVIDGVRLLRQNDQWATRFVFVRGGQVLGPHIRKNATMLDNPKRAIQLAAERGTCSAEQVLDVDFGISMLEAGSNFGHFLVSHLPKLQFWVRDGTYCSSGPSVLVDSPQAWHYDVLAAIGVPRHKIVPVSQTVREIRATRFVATDEKYLGGREPSFCRENLLWLRSQLVPAAHIDIGRTPMVYLEREPTARRVVLNTHDVRRLVSSLGGTTIQPIKLLFRDKIAAVKNRKVVLGTNGTELLLSIFSSEVTVVAIVPPGPHMHAIVAAVAMACGHRVWPFLCRNVYDRKVPADLRDMFVDIEELRHTLADVRHLDR